jgi:hypothetical protein
MCGGRRQKIKLANPKIRAGELIRVFVGAVNGLKMRRTLGVEA